MDERMWQAYEEKHRELGRRYRWLYLRTWLIWVAYFSVTTALAWWICYPRYHNPLIYFLVANTIYSIYLAMRATARYRREKEKQRRDLVEKAPMGRFQIH